MKITYFVLISPSILSLSHSHPPFLPLTPSPFADDDKVTKFLFRQAASLLWKIGNGELHSCIVDCDDLVDIAWKPHKSYFELQPEPITHFT